MTTRQSLPDAQAPERAEAKSAIYHLAAVAFGHPLPEFQHALEDGSFHQALNEAWQAVTGREWPAQPASADFVTLETGYIDAFMHGKGGKPRIPLLAGEYEDLLRGQARPVFMLNVQAFYKHFGLQPARGDEGRTEEPDHLSAMLEFLAVLAHLEARALAESRDAAPYRRAQRDFLERHLLPLLDAIRQLAAGEGRLTLDATLVRLIEELPEWARHQIVELEASVGRHAENTTDAADRRRIVDQDLWN